MAQRRQRITYAQIDALHFYDDQDLVEVPDVTRNYQKDYKVNT